MLKYEEIYKETGKLIIKIDEMREIMCKLIQEKSDLIDPEIVAVSQELDSVLNKYNKLLETVKIKHSII
ncbi:aspartyl-phosphate phosphatase Spo0E family protein [Clostridium sp. DJ247]|uniref:aspartyl-phosphate phosphatase Spo0E family protein n=1 Tax=Clostridium sp. DJ247 TaxID=2726188 RepID=UPI001627CC7A|nr:aspartyl-phosphate phosphatase Spo0E family protein [Clostridium sp. DJ247]MBC2581305.1 aspartyl-phosphate phosphatase Spo0E family protein [Clostridium sp. DJ247]